MFKGTKAVILTNKSVSFLALLKIFARQSHKVKNKQTPQYK